MLSHWPRAKMNKQCPELAVAQQVGVCSSASRHWCSSQIACPYFQCHSSKGFHHRYLDPLVGHRDNHTELRPEMVSFCERYRYSTQMACPYRPCHLSKGLDHPYSYALDRKSRRTKACNRQLLRKKSDRQREKHHVVLESSLHASWWCESIASTCTLAHGTDSLRLFRAKYPSAFSGQSTPMYWDLYWICAGDDRQC